MTSLQWLTSDPRNLEVSLRHSSNEQVQDNLRLVVETLAGMIHKTRVTQGELAEQIAGLATRLTRAERTLAVLLENDGK